MVEQREHGMIQADEKLQSQEQQLIEQNMKIEELQKALKVCYYCIYPILHLKILTLKFQDFRKL